jgi:hypothetical protein
MGSQFVYIGVSEELWVSPATSNHVGIPDMSVYNLIQGKTYTISSDVGMIWLTNDQGYELAITKEMVKIYFRPLSEIRNNKLNEILNK